MSRFVIFCEINVGRFHRKWLFIDYNWLYLNAIRYNIIQLLTWFEDNSSFVRPEDGSVGRSHQSITDLLYILIFLKLSYSNFLMFEKILMISIQQSENLDNAIPAHFDIVNKHSWRQDHVTCWSNENKAIGQQFDNGQ